jgi:hypothetical protein
MDRAAEQAPAEAPVFLSSARQKTFTFRPMRTLLYGLGLSLLVAACGSSIPIPNDQFAAAQKDVGRAQEGGAQAVPDAKLHLQLAQENLQKAKEQMDKDNRRAVSLISRASAEAELALALAKESQARAEAQEAADKLAKARGGK